jgi:hypothetical protein
MINKDIVLTTHGNEQSAASIVKASSLQLYSLSNKSTEFMARIKVVSTNMRTYFLFSFLFFFFVVLTVTAEDKRKQVLLNVSLVDEATQTLLAAGSEVVLELY